MKSDLLQFFEYAHLPPHLQETSRVFCILAHRLVDLDVDGSETSVQTMHRLVAWIETDFPANCESTWAQMKLNDAERMLSTHHVDEVLRKVLEAKDCAVRARLFKHPAPTS